MEQRIQKILSNCGFCSRRKAEVLIEEERIKVNKKTARLGDKVDPEKDTIYVDGKKIDTRMHRIYLMLNKPKSYLCSLKGKKGEKTIFDLLRIKERVYHVGRLDMRSRGLIILTNDGDFANKLMHPRYEIKKTYVVFLDNPIKDEHVRMLKKGIEIEERKTNPAKVQVLNEEGTRVELIIHEGRKHIVKKMFAYFGYKVIDLVRTRVGRLGLGDLREGKYRKITNMEIGFILNKKTKRKKSEEDNNKK